MSLQFKCDLHKACYFRGTENGGGGSSSSLRLWHSFTNEDFVLTPNLECEVILRKLCSLFGLVHL